MSMKQPALKHAGWIKYAYSCLKFNVNGECPSDVGNTHSVCFVFRLRKNLKSNLGSALLHEQLMIVKYVYIYVYNSIQFRKQF